MHAASRQESNCKEDTNTVVMEKSGFSINLSKWAITSDGRSEFL